MSEFAEELKGAVKMNGGTAGMSMACPATDNISVLQKLSFEKRDLESKIGRLVNFIESPSDGTVSSNQVSLLGLQLGHMKHYASCLNLRIADMQAQETA